jgi:predicted HicB family RNase H-like nuclease
MISDLKPFGLRIPPTVRQPLEARAKENGRSLNSEILQILKAALQHSETETKAA